MGPLKLHHFGRIDRRIVQDARWRAKVRHLTVENKRLQELVLHDPLTGLLNRRGFDQLFGKLFAAALRHGHHLTVAIVDIDHFKKINDTYGHKAGDQALQALGRLLSATIRTDDLVARWGGEEFILIFNETSLANAAVPLERLRKAVEALTVSGQGRSIKFTISAGYTSYEPTVAPNFLKPEAAEKVKADLFDRADRALYAAKAAGRNRISLEA